MSPGYPYLITAEWEENPYRANRIAEVLTGKAGFTVADMARLQTDVSDLHARTLLPRLLPLLDRLPDPTREERAAIDLLRRWDYVAGPDAGAALVWERWWISLNAALYQDHMPPLLFEYVSKRMPNVTDHLLLAAADGRPGLWVSGAGGLERLAGQAFRAAVADVVRLQGRDPSRWRWGRWHQMQFAHPLGKLPLLGWLLNLLPLPVGGNGNTVGAQYYDHATGRVFSAAPWRQVADLSDLASGSVQISAPGQSEHFLSPWYGNQAKRWAQGQYVPQSMRPEDYREGAHLELVPGAG